MKIRGRASPPFYGCAERGSGAAFVPVFGTRPHQNGDQPGNHFAEHSAAQNCEQPGGVFSGGVRTAAVSFGRADWRTCLKRPPDAFSEGLVSYPLSAFLAVTLRRPGRAKSAVQMGGWKLKSNAHRGRKIHRMIRHAVAPFCAPLRHRMPCPGHCQGEMSVIIWAHFQDAKTGVRPCQHRPSSPASKSPRSRRADVEKVGKARKRPEEVENQGLTLTA
jgi:hypothetical protein